MPAFASGIFNGTEFDTGVLTPATVAEFRASFPEFADTEKYPEDMVQFWLYVGAYMLPAVRWGRMLNIGLMLFVAHNVVLERLAAISAVAGAAPGLPPGVLTSKSVGPVSVSYDVRLGLTPEGGQFNLTTYGMRLLFLIRIVGAGPVHIGGGCYQGTISGGSQAWPGPWSGQFPNMNH